MIPSFFSSRRGVVAPVEALGTALRGRVRRRLPGGWVFALALALAGQDAVRADPPYRLEKDIPYHEGRVAADAVDPRCRLDVYAPTGTNGFPTVVWFHGGGLTGGSRSVPEGLKGQGIAVVAAGYRLSPAVKAPVYIEDAAAAVAWTFRHMAERGGATNRIYVSGHSAGGYLTAMIGLDKRWLRARGVDADAIAGLVPFSGQCITHFTIRAERGIPETQPVVDDLAPLFHVRKDAPPLLLITGGREVELLGRYEENAYLWRMMKLVGHPDTQLQELGGFDHGRMAEPAQPLLLRFIQTTSRARAALPGSGAGAADFPSPAPSARHDEKVAAVRSGRYDLVLIGDSITHTVGELGGKYEPLAAVWQRHFAPRRAINLGHNGYRTEQILWNLENGELDFAESPKVAVVLIGTNNSDDRHFPKVHTAEEIYAGTRAIVECIRRRHPTTKILVLRIFPRGGDDETGVSPPAFNSSARCQEICRRAGELTARLADGRQVFWLDVNHVFLRPDGRINTDLMWDLLHPSPAGAEAWAQAIEPTLARLMGDQPLATEVPSNTALVPVPKLENDSYDWYARHADVLRVQESINPEVVLIGDSITHFWGGEPKATQANGPASWQATFGAYRTLNLGFGWDRIQNVLWRLDHGELLGVRPRVVVLHIGTNNTSDTPNARQNTPEEIADGIRAIIRRLRARTPEARIVLMAVFPREQKPDHPRRARIAEINRLLVEFGQVPGITLVDLGPRMLRPDGTLPADIMGDFCHPTEKGYRLWGEALAPLLGAVAAPSALVPVPAAGR